MSVDSGKLIVIEGPLSGREYVLEQSELIVGRDERADIVLDAPSVSRRHARVVRQNGQYFIEDLDSSNGTFLNGQRLQAKALLADGDEIALGQAIKLRFAPPLPSAPQMAEQTVVEAAAPSEVAASQAKAPVQRQASELVIELAGQPAQVHRLEKETITLGRAQDNDIIIPSPLISRYHAHLERTGDSYRLLVLPDASNPVLFQEEAIRTPRLLQHEDELYIGQHDSAWRVTLAYRLSQEKAAAAPQAATEQSAEISVLRTAQAERVETPTATSPPQLQVQIAGSPAQSYELDAPRITIGRAEDNDVVLSSKIVSRHHAYLEQQNGTYRLVLLPDTVNPILFEGRPLQESRILQHEDKFRIGGLDPGSMVTMTYLAPDQAPAISQEQSVDFGKKTLLTLGRDASNDIVLDNPVISRFHAQIERVGQRYRVRDLRSSNGTFVNDERIEGEVWLQANDTVRIGSYRFVMGQDALAQFDESGGLRVEAVGLNKWVRKDLNILKEISLVFQPREFVVVVGQSGGGKSTLVDAVAGYRPATQGTVYVNDIDIYRNFDAIRNDIGYVPQRDIIHMELTVFQALDYAAQLRMPPDTAKEERHRRIMDVLEDLDLAHRKDTQISQLSGGQQKRVSIGVELLTKPGLFFLDEPTSGLDPGTETSLMQLMRRLADQGRTIVLITHATKNVMLADKVVFLARGGFLVWYGPPDEALTYFDQYRSQRDRRSHDIEFDEIYALLDDPANGSPQEWANRFQQHPAYVKYIERPLQETEHAPVAVEQKAAPASANVVGRARQQVSSLRQFMILSSRNIKILTRDKFSLLLMLAAAPLVAMLQVVLAGVLGRDPFDFSSGNFPVVLIILFLPSVYAVMVGGIAQMREIVKERDVYKRERLVNLRIFPYVMSKIWVAALLALYQTACYVVVHNLAFAMPGGLPEYALMYVSLGLATMAGMMLGLFASAVAPNANSAPLIVILFMVPQIVLGGALVPLPSFVNAPISTRWAFQGWMAISGAGSDVARDACWDLASEQRRDLSTEFKNENCNCMGVNALNANSCNFPGVGQFYSAAIDQAPPAEPGDPPAEPTDEDVRAQIGEPPSKPDERPAEPELPPQPVKPENEADQIAMADYFAALEDWQVEVDQIREDYRSQLAAYEEEVKAFEENFQRYQEQRAEIFTNYQSEFEAYGEQVQAYQTVRTTWEAERLAAVVPAEGMIRQFDRDFGWTFVDKNDAATYWRTLYTTWIAQLIIIGVLFVAILIAQKRKDAN